MFYVFMTLAKGRGGGLGECYVISGGWSVVLLLLRNVIWGRGVKNGHFILI